jgi:hypothetical protein
VAVARSVDEQSIVAGALMWLGWARLLLGELDRAREAFEDDHLVASQLGGPLLLGFVTSKLGLLADAERDYAKAIDVQLEAYEVFAGFGDRGGAGYAQGRASMSAYCLGDSL